MFRMPNKFGICYSTILLLALYGQKCYFFFSFLFTFLSPLTSLSYGFSLFLSHFLSFSLSTTHILISTHSLSLSLSLNELWWFGFFRFGFFSPKFRFFLSSDLGDGLFIYFLIWVFLVMFCKMFFIWFGLFEGLWWWVAILGVVVDF